MQRQVRKIQIFTPVKVGQAWCNLSLICIMSIPIHIPNFKSIFQNTAEKSMGNQILAKGNNYCKSRSSVTELKLDVYDVMTNSYTKFKVNISKDCREKSGKPECDGQTYWQTYREQSVPRKARRGLITRGPKGHKSCTRVQFAIFLMDPPGQPFLLTDWPKNNKRPKGPHHVHLSTMCHLFLWICQDGHFYLLFGPKNTNLVEDVEILLPIKFRWIPFSSCRGKVEMYLSQQRPGRPSCFLDQPEKHKLGRGH